MGALALLPNAAERRNVMTEQSSRLLIIVAPLLSYGLSIVIGGNGFISAFVCGIAMAVGAHRHTSRTGHVVYHPFSWRDRLAISWLGPRGTPSIMFGLLAFNALDAQPADATVMTVVLVVLGSIVVHGAGSPAVARMYLRSEGCRCTS